MSNPSVLTGLLTHSRYKPFAVAATCALCVAILGGLATDVGPWYHQLRKPSFQPPDWLFGPAWTIIYALATVSAATAWWSLRTARMRSIVVTLFCFNMFLNVLWSVLFFRLHRPDFALIEVTLLWSSVAALIWVLRVRVPRASWLLLPYLLWVTFASVLNMAVVQLNPPFVP